MDDEEGSPFDKRIRTNFFSAQAQELSKPASKQGPVQIVLALICIAVAVGFYQLVLYLMNYDKLMAMKNVEVTFEKPFQSNGIASVQVDIANYNAAPIRNSEIKYTIAVAGEKPIEGKVKIPTQIPAGDSRSFVGVQLGAVGEKAGHMQAELVNLDYGPKPSLSPELQAKFVEAAALEDKEAVQQFEDFVKEAPTFAPGFVDLGLAYAANGRFDKACEAYKKAIAIDPESANAHYNLGVAYFYKKDQADARQELAEAARLAPDDPTITASAKQLQ